MKKYNVTVYFIISLVGFLAVDLSLSAKTVEKNNFLFMTLEQLLNTKVKTATKTTEKSSLSPAIISVISATDINNYGYKSVAEALSHVTGFVDNYDLAMHNFSVRGINAGARSGSRTIKFMLDGQAIAFRSTSQNFIDKELIPMDIIERIEVIRGPVSALYGANAFLGVVNIVTKTGDKFAETGGAFALEQRVIDNAGNGYGLNVTYGNSNKDWDYSIGFSGNKNDRSGIKLPRRSPSYDDFSMPESKSDTEKPFSFYARSLYKIDENSAFKMSGFYQRLAVENPFSDINPLQTMGTTNIALDNLFVRSDYDIKLSEKIYAHVFSAYSQGGTLADDKIEIGVDSFFLTRRFAYTGVDIGGEIFVDFKESDSLLLGFDAKRDKHKIETFSRVERVSGESIQLNPDRDETLTDVGFYFQYLKQINQSWKAIVGFRSDDDSVTGTQTSARLGLVAQMNKDLILKLLAGSSFQAPSAELLYRTAVQAGDIIGNPDLAAQKAKTLEFSAAMPFNEFLHLTATYFNTQVEELVIFESDTNNLFANNSSGSRTNGFEIETRLIWHNLNGYLNYSWQETKRDRNPFSLSVLEYREKGELSPEQSANFGMSYFYKEPQINLSLNNRWVSKREASSQNVLYSNQFYQLDSYLDSTLTISTNSYSMLKNMQATVQFQVKDLFDNNYVNPGFGGIEFPSLGRHYSLSFEQRF